MSAPTIAVVGATGTGLVYHLDRLPADGETMLTDRLDVVPGGKAFNHAVGVSRLGARARLLSALGSDPLARLSRDVWRAEGVDAAGVDELEGVPSLIGSVLVDGDGANRIVIGTGAMGRYSPEHVARHAGAIQAADLLLVSLEMPVPPALEALAVARAAGVITLLNPAPAPSPAETEALMPLVDWVTPNEGEARAMTGLADPAAAAARLRDLGAGSVVVTLGEHGALLAGDAGQVTIPAVRVDRVVDTSGAGDAFNCAFAVALANGLDPVTAAGCGCLAASLIVQGPNFFDALGLWERLPAGFAGSVA